MSKLGAAFTVNDTSGEVTSGSVGAKSTLASLADGTSIERDSSTGALKVAAQGATHGAGVPAAGMSRFAGSTLKGSLVANDAAGGALSLANPFGVDVIVELDVHLTAKSAGACTIDFGVAGGAAVSSNTLMDGLDVNPGGTSAPFARSSTDSGDAGASGRSRMLWRSGQFITGSMATGATAGLVGTFVARIMDAN